MSINLAKGQAISLEKADHTPLHRVRLGLGWDAAPRGLFGRTKEVDLDASAILLSGQKAIDIVYYGQLSSKDGAITHTGDNRTGDGNGDDEQILINLAQLPEHIDTVVFVITSYTGQRFNEVQNVYARVNDVASHDEEVARYNLAEYGDTTGNVIAKFTRAGTGWKFTALGIPANGKTAKALVPAALATVTN
ncbi:TerD family protein [Curtobacterium sp. MCSS17_016]|uniref:TerD family protein n=1 Tax=Curtobacterium sp. MCSS17_016 TaxID=2175644 RepID=UPI000DA8230F|nr:TerD family protein [Curtobacterium sp. MCSS17_016]WIE81119.1 TerD family protein [Curtobacterium sp. MCSS17_016]